MFYNQIRMDDIKLFQLKKAKYKSTVEEILQYLHRLEHDLEFEALHLAINDKWKKWNEGMSEGSRFQFNLGMLSNTGDKCVDEVLALTFQIEAVRLELMKNNHITYEDNTD